jgi:hypothetical protein
VRERTIALGVAGSVLFGWALVAAADARHGAQVAAPEVVVRTVIVVEESAWDRALAVETPLVDALVDWVEVERQTDCLWEFLQASGVEITLEIVLAAGTWTDALGGACLVIGEDDVYEED